MRQRDTDDQFSPTLASTLIRQPTPNIFAPVAKAVSNIGALVDNQEKKEQKREVLKNEFLNDKSTRELKRANTSNIYDGLLTSSLNRDIKQKKEKRESDEFDLRYKTIKNKVADNSNLAKFLTSGKSYEEFIKENGAFLTPTATKTAMDFSNKNKTMLQEEEYKKQLGYLETDPRFMVDGKFDTKKATEFMAKKIRRGEVDSKLGYSLIDGLHKATSYNIYAKPQREPTYAPTEAMRAYKENLSMLPPEEREQYRKDHPFTRFRDEYNDAKKMSSGVSTTNLINSSVLDLSKKYNIANFADYDFGKALKTGQIKSSELENLKRVMANSKQAQFLEREMTKKLGGLGTIAGQAKNFAKYANSEHVDTNFFKAKVDSIKSYIPGLTYDEKQIENEEFRRDFLNISSTMLKLQSGLTVSDKEMARFEQSMGTFSKNKTSNFIGVKKKLLDTLNEFKGLKAIDPQYFNLKYGEKVRGLERSIDIIDKFLHPNSSPKRVGEEKSKSNAGTGVIVPDGTNESELEDI